MSQPEQGSITSSLDGVQIQVKAVPGSSCDRIAGWLGDHLKVAVAAPPEAGKANKALCRMLAHALGVRPQQVQVVAGTATARKKVLVAGITVEQARQRLGQA